MRFTSKVQLWLPGQTVERRPTFWEQFFSVFGAKYDLREEELATTRTVLSIAESMSSALWSVGVTNAVALVVDRRVLFHDLAGASGDVPVLLQAARHFSPQFADGFSQLDAVFERHEHGLHTVIEAHFRARFRPEEPCAEITFGSRIDALRARPDESRETVRSRVRKSLSSRTQIDAWQSSFNALLARVGEAIRKSFPEGQISGGETIGQVVKPSRETVTATAKVPRSQRVLQMRPQPLLHRRHDAYHDPWNDWYEDPGYVESEFDALEVFADLAEHAPSIGHGIHVVHEHGAPIGEADTLSQSSPALAGIDAASAIFDAPAGTSFDAALGAYGADDPKPQLWSSNDAYDSGASSVSSSDCASSDCMTSDCATKSDCSDCVSSDCAKSDCSYDCASSDCASSDCASSDCASSDCASSDCASSDCASSDCASSDCSYDCSS